MPLDHFVGRTNDVERMRNVLLGKDRADGNLTIQSIEGPGGIGKSFLLEHVLAQTDLRERKYLTCRLNGGELTTASLTPCLERLVHGAQSHATRDKPPGFYFPSVASTVRTIDKLRFEAIAEFQRLRPSDQEGQAALSTFLDVAFRTGKRINDINRITRDYVNVDAVERILIEAIPKMRSLLGRTPGFRDRLGLGHGKASLRNAVKEDACRPLADALVADLSAILSGYRKRSLLHPTSAKIAGIDRLLIILDDYEKLQDTIGGFLLGYLLPALRDGAFESTVLILGRDRLEATDRLARWGAFQPNLCRRIELKPFSRSEMDQLVESYGAATEAEKTRAWNDTQGYPYHVELWMQEASKTENGGPSALMLRMFHDKTTRWMTPAEKDWLRQVLFLNEVNVRTLHRMICDADKAKRAFEWFESEPSIRDVSSRSFRVREFLRSRLVEYIRISDPDSHDELTRRGERAVELNASQPVEHT